MKTENTTKENSHQFVPEPNQSPSENRAFISCLYTERTYEGIQLSLDNGKEGSAEIFKSNSPQKDFNDAYMRALKEGYYILVSSSWHNFISDALTAIAK